VDDVDELAVNISFEYINGKSTSTCIWPAFYRRIVKELDDLGWKHVEYVDKELTTIILIIIDGADRKHLLHFNGLQPDSYACCAIAVSCESICYELPTALSVERLQTITTLFEEFSAQIHAYQDVWNELDGFDGDDKKSRADLQRRVSLAGKTNY
jgi:hypothetical protein